MLSYHSFSCGLVLVGVAGWFGPLIVCSMPCCVFRFVGIHLWAQVAQGHGVPYVCFHP